MYYYSYIDDETGITLSHIEVSNHKIHYGDIIQYKGETYKVTGFKASASWDGIYIKKIT